MPRVCSAGWCGCKESDVRLFRFPAQDGIKQQWVNFCRRDHSFKPGDHHRVCENHFEDVDFLGIEAKRRNLHHNAIPTVMVQGTASQTLPVVVSAYPEDVEQGQGSKRKYEEDVEMEREMQHLRKKLKNEKQKTRRLSIQRIKLRDLLDESKTNKLMSEDALQALRGQFSDSFLDLIKNELDNKDRSSNGYRYSKEVKRFALSVHFHSPDAYNWIRKQGIHLPEERTLRNWRSGVECEAGYHTQALKSLSEMSGRSKDPVYATLMVDAMAIRKQVTWNNSSKRFEGFEDLGDDNESDSKKPAAEALVFMAVGLNGHWKVPIGYFLINGISGEQQAALVREGLHHLHEAGIQVVAFVSDGCGTNHKTAVHLGCNLLADQLRGTFPHPVTGEPVSFLFDVVHMIKLMRNTLASERTLHLPPDEPGGAEKNIEWKYVTKLNDIQRAEGLRLGNKLRKKHIEFESQKMKVSLAAQTLSNSVAMAIQYMRQLVPEEFGDSEATSEWMKKIDRLFDMLNSRNPFAWNYKAPIKMSNEKIWRPFLSEMREMLLQMKDSKGRRLATGMKKTAIIGLCLAIDAVFHLADTLLATKKMRYLLTYKLSQDHLELFFCSVRGRGGWNNNPSVTHFRGAWRTLLLNNTIGTKRTGNCKQQDSTHLLDIVDICYRRKNNVPDSDNGDDAVNDEDEYLPHIDLTILAENISCYICGYVVRQQMKSTSCEECKAALIAAKPKTSVGDEDYRCFLQMKDRGGLTMPSRSVFLIGKKCEQVFRGVVGVGAEDDDIEQKGKVLSRTNLLQRMEILTLRDLDTQNLFPDLQSHVFDSELSISNHCNRLIRRIAAHYLKIRLHEYSKVYTATLKKSNLRKKLTKLVLFKNQ